MTQLWGGMRPVALAAMWACVNVGTALAADGSAATLPETTVAAPAQQADALDPAQTPYATELLNRAEMERQQVLDIRDATRDMVNVEVPREPKRGTGISGVAGRAGNSGFEIRGLGGNRVLTLVDGIPQPQANAFMNSHSFGRDYVDPLTLSGIEVHKGASRIDMPSGGIGGSVNLRTLAPSDLLQGGKTLAGRALLGWRSESQGRTVGAALAGQASDQLQWLFSLNGDWSDEIETMGTVGGAGKTRTKANPEDNQRSSVLAKLVYRPDGGQTHVLTGEHRKQSTWVNGLNDFDTSTRSHVDDMNSKRSRVSLKSDFALNAVAADTLSTYFAWQDSSNTQDLTLDTTTRVRQRNHTYGERVLQGGAQARKQLGQHGLHYGLELSRTDFETDSIKIDAGTATPDPKGPDARSTNWGLFVEDRIQWGNWALKPGIRYTSIDIKPDASSIDTSATGAKVVSKRFDAWLPQLGGEFNWGNGLQAFASYQRGMRAPTSGELNNVFGNLLYGYAILPNPNLKAETSNNFEMGLRDSQGPLQWEASAFYGRYRNFIQDGIFVGTVNGVQISQSVNEAKATIKGIELKGKAELGQSWGGVWNLRGGAGYTKGKGADGQGLESISPWQLKLGVGQKAARWNWELAATHAAGKKQRDLAKDSSALFLSPSFTVLDLTAQLELRKGLRLNLGLFNLTDKKYWNWSDVRGVTSATERAAIDAYSQPGRNVRVSLVADF